MRVSVILSTYNAPVWLEKSLWGYIHQAHRDLQIVIADDGSGDPTRRVIESLRAEGDLDIEHVWHEDDGFRKSEILNKAILAADADYLIFSDGDCIPRSDFVEIHVAQAAKGRFLSGGYFKLPLETSRAITRDDVASGRFGDPRWLREHGVRGVKASRLRLTGNMGKALDAMTPTKASWNGHNASGWKADLLEANGFDERMRYGGQDRELGERLVNAGLTPRQIRHRAFCFHLDHDRPWRTRDSIDRNLGIRRETRAERITRTRFGIRKDDADSVPQKQAR